MEVIKTQKITRKVEIGELDGTKRLPMAPRKEMGRVDKCAACGEVINDEYFVAGFKQGHPNMLLHEACVVDA